MDNVQRICGGGMITNGGGRMGARWADGQMAMDTKRER